MDWLDCYSVEHASFGIHELDPLFIMILNILSIQFEAGGDESRVRRPHFRHEFDGSGNFHQLFPLVAADAHQMLLNFSQNSILY